MSYQSPDAAAANVLKYDSTAEAAATWAGSSKERIPALSPAASIKEVRPTFGQRMRSALGLLFPTLVVIVPTAGLASALLGWVLWYRVNETDASLTDTGAFLLDEGTKIKEGLESARLTGLTISALAAAVTTFTAPFLVGLFAYQMAGSWLAASGGSFGTSRARKEDGLPTPLQFGILMNLLSTSGINSLFVSIKYALRNKKNKFSVPPIFQQSIFVCLIVYVLTHVCSGVDIWLHTTTATVVANFTESLPMPFPYGISQNTCKPYPDPLQEGTRKCLFEVQGQWTGSIGDGRIVASNNSATLRPITLAASNDLAVLVKPNVQARVAFNMTTFGARAICSSLNANLCKPSTSDVVCTKSNDFPFVDGSLDMGIPGYGQSQSYIFTSTCDGCVPKIQNYTEAGQVVPSKRSKNPIDARIQFVWGMPGDMRFYDNWPNPAINRLGTLAATVLANCSLGFYNVTLSYKDGSYSLVNEALSDTWLSDGLSGPTLVNLYGSRLLVNIEGVAMGLKSNTTDEVMALLRQELGRLALGSAAEITDQTIPTLSQSQTSQKLLGRYPMAPTIAMIAILYLYAFVGLVLGLVAMTVTARSPHITEPRTGATVSAIELAQLRLTQPLTLVASLFPSADDESRATRSATTTAVELFDERSGASVNRVRVGFSRVGSQNEFGAWKDASD